jgi:hypothetical protein
LVVAVVCPAVGAAAGDLTVWAVDPHTKVFRDTEPEGATRVVKLRAARNEDEPAEVALRAPEVLQKVGIELTALTHEEGEAKIDGGAITWHFVGFIPLKKNTPRSDRLRVRAAPCEVPDPLLDARTIDIEANATQPVWVTVHVPADATPGKYRGEVAVVAGEVRQTLPIELTVDPFTLPDQRHLFVTNWFRAGSIASAHGTELWSEAFWSILARYAQNMADHRQNVVLVPWTLVKIMREPDGRLSFDYTRFDRFVELFEKAGAADRIELSHLGHFGAGGWSGKEIVLRKNTTDTRR